MAAAPESRVQDPPASLGIHLVALLLIVSALPAAAVLLFFPEVVRDWIDGPALVSWQTLFFLLTLLGSLLGALGLFLKARWGWWIATATCVFGVLGNLLGVLLLILGSGEDDPRALVLAWTLRLAFLAAYSGSLWFLAQTRVRRRFRLEHVAPRRAILRLFAAFLLLQILAFLNPARFA